jgi:hypothetical protein
MAEMIPEDLMDLAANPLHSSPARPDRHSEPTIHPSPV